MKRALFAGTFDPPTLGHLDIIKRASKVCDKLYIGIATNYHKRKQLFSLEEKKELIQAIITGLSNVEVISFSGLIIQCAQELKIDFLFRGIRTAADLEFECQMASANYRMAKLETLFLMAESQYVHLSSTIIKEIASYGQRLHAFVPAAIEEAVFNKLSQRVET